MPLIEIPGYHILRQLGRGGMATVYLATQESVQRDVALKVMSPALQTDPDFSERFLREARIAAKLHHRHVVGIHDVGRHGDHNYIAMEYLGGGAVLPNDGSTRPLAFALRITREIALALNYAHAKGFVHRDVKPDNILLREDGSSALTDFGIARAADSATRMTRTGAVIGTPHYMSPEQARGKTVDGRADLYSLGIVLHELLLGRVPYTAEDSLAVGIMHINEPVPVLPERYAALQPLLDHMLAKQPEDRYQNGQQLADAIERFERALEAGEHPELARSAADSGEFHFGNIDLGDDKPVPGSARPTTPAVAFHHRADPSLGRLDDLGETGSYRAIGRGTPRRAAKRSTGARGWFAPAAIALVLVVLGAAGWHWQDRLRSLVPNTQLNDTIARAQKALADGKLLGDGGARALFQSVRAQDPDNDQAREGLNQVGERLLAEAREALRKNDLATARSDLDAANDILGGGAEVEGLKSALDAAQAQGSKVENLLARADTALTANRLFGADGAATLYRQILEVDAGNAVAKHGLDKVAAAQAQLARDALAQGDIDLANQRVGQLAELAPNHAAIPELRTALAQRRAADTQAQDQQLVRAERALGEGKLAGPEGAQALFGAVLKSDANNALAKAGLRKVGLAYAAQAGVQLDANNSSAAEAALRQAEALAGNAEEVRRVRARMRDQRESDAIAQEQLKEPSLADRARIEDMLAEADRALAAGVLMDPGGAYDKYRAVLGIDGNNTRAMEGLKRIAPRARTLFDQSLGTNRPNAARGYLDAIADTDPGNPAIIGLRERLANAYLDQADRYVGRGQRGEATRALNAARQLSPANPRSAALEARIENLPAGS
ncbi:MAG: protein kinase [Rudaea sp.]|uniref:protein kinase domain-containing protein n=1 Tax=unclassified Rudaea TaxID=2627037 RepID=UPI00148516D9|nr:MULTISPECIES: protein kinase [unclassified Rudaea]MBN8886384.1 protein kinase [Rudaea sp.]